GVSGAGKSTLVQKTLYPVLAAILAKKKNDESPTKNDALPYDELFGTGQVEDVVLIDQTPIARSPRSNPLTYIKAFDLIRAVFAEQPDGKARGLESGAFSFNVPGGRCEACEGAGHIAIDMQFMADVYMRCSECGGKRYRRAVLDVKYRGVDISEVLGMTAR